MKLPKKYNYGRLGYPCELTHKVVEGKCIDCDRPATHYCCEKEQFCCDHV